jgi:hypothetical protein
VVPASFRKKKVFIARDDKTLFVDTVKIESHNRVNRSCLPPVGWKRRRYWNQIVSVCRRWHAVDVGIVQGDSIVKVAVKRTVTSQNDKMMEETEQEIAPLRNVSDLTDGRSDWFLPPADGNEMLVLTSEESARNPKLSIVNPCSTRNEPDRKPFRETSPCVLSRGIKLNDALSRRLNGGTGDRSRRHLRYLRREC